MSKRKRVHSYFGFNKKFQGIGFMISSDGHVIYDYDFYDISFKLLWFSGWIMIYKK